MARLMGSCFGAALCWLLPCWPPSLAATLVSADGVLAVRAAGDPSWRVPAVGESLPEIADIRTAGTGPCRLQFGRDTCWLDADTHLALSRRADGQRATLHSGRLLIAASDQPWSIAVGGQTLHLKPQPVGCSCVVEYTSQQTVRLEVLAGRVAISEQHLETGQAATWSPNQPDRIQTQRLGNAQRQQAARWATVAQSGQGLGQLLIQDPQWESPVRLQVARYHVNVVLQPPVALVQIDQSFYNPYAAQREGTFVFNLPNGASVSRFAMYVTPDELIEGEIVERRRGVQIYERIVRSQRDPAILEQIGDNLFKMRVFPIFARDVKRILLDFTLPLESPDGHYAFRLPLLSDLEPVWDFRITGALLGPVIEDRLHCASHPQIQFRRDDGRTAFHWSARNYRPEGEFVVNFAAPPPHESQVRATVLPPLADAVRLDQADPASRRETAYFLATLVPPPEPDEAPGPVDLVVLADTSSGSAGQAALRPAVRAILHNLRPEDRVKLGCVDVGCRWLHDGWLQGTEQVQAALRQFEREVFLGITDLGTSFAQAFDALEQARPSRRVVVYVGDGQDVVGTRASAAELADRLQPLRATFFVVQTAAHGRGDLVRTLADARGGIIFDVAQPARFGDLLQWVLSGMPEPIRIETVRVEGADEDELMFPPAVLPGRTWRLYGRVAPCDVLRVEAVTSRIGRRQTHSWHLKVEASDEDIFLGRLWAQRRVEQLQRQSPGDPLQTAGNSDRITALSREWSLLTPQTAFLVLESEDEYPQWGIDRRARRRYWKPAEAVRHEPLPEAWIERVAPPAQHPRLTSAKRLEQVVAAAREAIAAEDYERAELLLGAALRMPGGLQSAEVGELSALSAAGIKRQQQLKEFGTLRLLVDPRAARFDRPPQPNVLRLLQPEWSAQFLRIHPHARALLKEVSVEPAELPLRDFAQRLAEWTGVQVHLDHRALHGGGLDENSRLPIDVWGKITLGQYARFALESAGLALVPEQHMLRITTSEAQAAGRLRTEVYPVADLYLADRPTDPGLLAHPLLDREQEVVRRVSRKLRTRRTLRYQQTPLRAVAEDLAETLNEAVFLDRRALDEVGVRIDQPIDGHFNDCPLHESLAHLLRPLELTAVPGRGGLMLTTEARLEECALLRLHSVRGLVFETWQVNDFFDGGGGFFGGMGGAGFGGGGGQFGGALSGSTPAGRGIDFSEGTGQAGLSDSATRAAPEGAQPPDEDRSADGENPLMPEAVVADLPAAAGPPLEGEYVVDFDTLCENITNNIEPDGWFDAGGPGELRAFRPTLDLVVRATPTAHEEIESLLSRLRALPVVAEPRGTRLAQPRFYRPGEIRGWELDELVELCTSTVHPDHWSDFGGTSNIAIDPYRMALVVRGTQPVHEELWSLLAQLRRSRNHRVGPLHDQRPLAGWVHRHAELPPADAHELQALAARKVPQRFSLSYRIVDRRSRLQDRIALQVDGSSRAFQWAGQDVRVSGPSAAVAVPDLMLVETGPWGEAALRRLDSLLPWLPHRSNDQLARRFAIQRLPDRDNSPRDLVRIRAALTPAETDRNYLEIAFSTEHGLPVEWFAVVDGQPAHRLSFEGLRFDPIPCWRTVRLHAGEQELLRWELVDTQAPARVANLRDWPGYAILDNDSEAAGAPQPLRLALTAMRAEHWSAAAEALQPLLAERPEPPLARFLWAWCCDREKGLAAPQRVWQALERVASSPAAGLARSIAEGTFELSAAQRYALAQRMPGAVRTPADWERLAQLALAAGRPVEAVAHQEAALRRGHDDIARQTQYVALLLRAGRRDQAADVAADIVAKKTAPLHRITELAEHFARNRQWDHARSLLDEALKREGLEPLERFELLSRQAALVSGSARWKLLVRAHALVPPQSEQAARVARRLIGEVQAAADPAAAGALAEAAGDAGLAVQLRLLQVELTPAADEAAPLVWKLIESQALPAERLGWAAWHLNRAGHRQQLVEVLEEHIRRGGTLSDETRRQLRRAYLALGRVTEARRAVTRDPIHPEPQ